VLADHRAQAQARSTAQRFAAISARFDAILPPTAAMPLGQWKPEGYGRMV
jgi:hypothetical protein